LVVVDAAGEFSMYTSITRTLPVNHFPPTQSDIVLRLNGLTIAALCQQIVHGQRHGKKS